MPPKMLKYWSLINTKNLIKHHLWFWLYRLYWVWCLIEKIYGGENNPENSFTTKVVFFIRFSKNEDIKKLAADIIGQKFYLSNVTFYLLLFAPYLLLFTHYLLRLTCYLFQLTRYLFRSCRTVLNDIDNVYIKLCVSSLKRTYQR